MNHATDRRWNETHRSTHGKTLILALVGILALAGVGALAGALYDQGVPELTDVEVGPGTDARRPEAPAQRGPMILPQVETSPLPGETPTDPAPAPTDAPLPSPSPTDSVVPPGEGTSVLLPAGPLTVSVPTGWQHQVSDTGEGMSAWSGTGDLVWMQLWQTDPASTDAAGILAQNLSQILPTDIYTQLETSPVTNQQPFGSLLSFAGVAYRGVVVDAQGSWPVLGNLWVALRQDGRVLFVTADASPPEQFAQEAWRPLVESAFNGFAFPQG